MHLPAGYTTRPATLADVPAAVELFNTCAIAQIGRPEVNETDMQIEWADPRMDLEHNTRLILAPEGQFAGYVELYDRAPHVKFWLWGCVHPEHTGRGLGTTLMTWAEERARVLLQQAPEEARVILQTSVVSTDEVSQALYHARGFTLNRHFLRMVIEMDAPPPLPVLPPGILIRPYDPETEFEAVLHTDREAFRDHWGFVESPFEEMLAQWQHWIDHDPDYDPTLWFLALDGAEIAGISLCSSHITEDPELAWVNTLGVRREWRRQGIALALLQHSFGEFYRRGKRKVGLGVDAQSLTGATRLYERAGMHVVRTYSNYEKELRPGVDLAKKAL